jgi:hypothetical protein
MGSLDATISKVFVGDDGIYVFKIQMCSRIDLGEAHMSNDWRFKALASTDDDTGDFIWHTFVLLLFFRLCAFLMSLKIMSLERPRAILSSCY